MILLALFFFASTLEAKEILVCSGCEVSSVKQAVEIAASGDTIRIKKGIYREHEIEIIDKSLTIIGEDFPVIDAEMKGTAFKIKAENFSIEGLHIKNIGTSHTSDQAAILVSRSKNFSIKNNRLSNIFFGILLERSSAGMISNNKIRSKARSQANSGNGIHIWHSEDITVKNNDIQGVRDGIYLEFANNCNIINNICKDNLRYGLHFMFSDHNAYLDNLFENNGAGVAVMYSKFIEMHRNHFRKKLGQCLLRTVAKRDHRCYFEAQHF